MREVMLITVSTVLVPASKNLELNAGTGTPMLNFWMPVPAPVNLALIVPAIVTIKVGLN